MTKLHSKQTVWAYVRKKWRPTVVIMIQPMGGGVLRKQDRAIIKTPRGKKEYSVPATRRFVRFDPPMRQTVLNFEEPEGG